jgi:hypothetical protein
MSNQFHGDHKQSTYQTLQRLRQQSRASLAGVMSRRAMTTFNLQREPEPDHANQMVNVMVYPQNPFVGEPEVRQMPAADIQPGLINGRLQVDDSRGVITEPDENGDYLFWPGDPSFDQVNAFYYATFTLRMYERYAHREIPWAFASPRITIDPHIGMLANAFYNEEEHLLGFHTFRNRNGEPHSTARSADIVTHETAHAVLDGLRDLHNESFGLGPRAFHESFGDITAMLVGLHDDTLVRRLLKLTDGDLQTSNFITEVAEYLARETSSNPHYTREHTIYLRNAFNKLEAISFDRLTYLPDQTETELSRQEHNYSRLFTGAIYDLLVGIYEHKCDHDSHSPLALHRARDVVGHLLVMAIELGPAGEFDFIDIARAFLSADSILYDGLYRAIITDVFASRKILSQDEANAHLDTLQNLPLLKLPQSLNTSLSAVRFLEDEILPALSITPEYELMPMATYRNAEGYAFMTFFSVQSVQMRGEQYQSFDGVEVDIFGGLTLTFDSDNTLCSAVYRPVYDEDIRQLRIIVAELIQHNRVTDNLHPPQAVLRPNPKGLLIDDTLIARPRRKLIKYPVIFDEIPDGIRNFAAYLASWQHDSPSQNE